jgi:hypothetical protein
MAFINKYLNILETSSWQDTGKAKIYDAVDCASPKLHLCANAGGDHACGLVASSVNDPRKLLVMHTDTDAQGNVTKTPHYINMISGGTQYTLLSQLEGGISHNPNVFNGVTGIHRLNDKLEPTHWGDHDYTFDDVSQLYNTYLEQPKLAIQHVQYVNAIYFRIDGVETLAVIPFWNTNYLLDYPAIANGTHTLGYRMHANNNGVLNTYWDDCTCSIWQRYMIASNAGK